MNDFGACDVTVARVDFCAPPASIAASYDAVIAADCVYSPETATALVATVRTALTPGGLALVVCAETRVRFAALCSRVAPSRKEATGHVGSSAARVALPGGGGGLRLTRSVASPEEAPHVRRICTARRRSSMLGSFFSRPRRVLYPSRLRRESPSSDRRLLPLAVTARRAPECA